MGREHIMPGNFEITIGGLATMMPSNFTCVCQAYQFSNKTPIKAFGLIKHQNWNFLENNCSEKRFFTDNCRCKVVLREKCAL